ncbi:hypothetical protein BJ875DRAFT_526572 [Amylocarpus encephaloides]|uniref:C3H1-type domain-containing protein n=1 Tax=Amylocarpus encephaloides TaxID=45428 RepID=A0A9P7YM17_9HELO|nr:hypothetical protein BJ875DRAFT_526572 [Amylocarpus encephaloides]
MAALCIAFQNGRCNFGARCRFIHESVERLSATEPSPGSSSVHVHTRQVSSTATPRNSSEKKAPGATNGPSLPKPSRGPSREAARMLKGAGVLISTLYAELPETPLQVGDPVEIKNCEFQASYSWKDVEHPTIYVPSCPPKWSPPNGPFQMAKDRTKKTSTGKRSPAAAVDPMFQALLHMHPDYNMTPIALVTDRNSLRKLLTFASNGSGKWRIDVDMVGDTMFFSPWEDFRRMLINGQQDTGYGHEFEKHITSVQPGMEDVLCHDRVVRYNLGGMECLVRFEADAYVEDENHLAAEDTSPINKAGRLESNEPRPSPPVLKPPYKLVHLIPRGQPVNPTSIVEIKSHSGLKPNTSKALPQLWISQTKLLCSGRHVHGLVTDELRLRVMEEELGRWRERNQGNLQNMMRVIRDIKAIAREQKRCTVICQKADGRTSLRVYRGKGGEFAIRPEVVERCWGRWGGS